MKRHKNFTAAVFLAGAALLLPAAAAAGLFGAAELKSVWSGTGIKIDGSAEDWAAAEPAEKSGLAVAAANDGAALYLCVSALDRESSAQLSGAFKQTFTLWLDGKGGKKKVYGVRLTAKTADRKTEKPSDPASDAGAAANGRKRQAPGAASYEAVIVGADGDEHSLAADGAEFRAGLNSKKRAMFEFRLPLAMIFDKAGENVGVGVETSEIDESALPAKPGDGGEAGGPGGRGGAPPGGMDGAPGGRGETSPGGMGGGPGGRGGTPPGGMGGGPGMGSGGSSGGAAPALPDPISFWLKVKLAGKSE